MRTLLLLATLPVFCAVVPVPGTAVSLEPPAGMEPAARFAGFESKTEAVTILVNELAAPVAGITAGFADPARLAGQKMTLDSRDKVKLPAGEGELFTFTQQRAGAPVKKLILAIGDEKRTILVSANCEVAIAPAWEPKLKASLLTATLAAPQANIAGFKVAAKGPFKEARAMAGSLALTPGGAFPIQDRRGPIFLVSRSLTPIPVESVEEFAKMRATDLPGVKEFRVTESKNVMVDGLAGLELSGVANETNAETAHLVYELILREASGGYYIAVGLAPMAVSKENLALFQAMGASFSRK